MYLRTRVHIVCMHKISFLHCRERERERKREKERERPRDGVIVIRDQAEIPQARLIIHVYLTCCPLIVFSCLGCSLYRLMYMYKVQIKTPEKKL